MKTMDKEVLDVFLRAAVKGKSSGLPYYLADPGSCTFDYYEARRLRMIYGKKTLKENYAASLKEEKEN